LDGKIGASQKGYGTKGKRKKVGGKGLGIWEGQRVTWVPKISFGIREQIISLEIPFPVNFLDSPFLALVVPGKGSQKGTFQLAGTQGLGIGVPGIGSGLVNWGYFPKGKGNKLSQGAKVKATFQGGLTPSSKGPKNWTTILGGAGLAIGLDFPN